ncbi:plexin-A4-like, partial [Ylistrum balloti]|uniref:plexin-A4-like n=1 Tax=Ylistrum balloti TaxID=509963 RepID=UPI002905E060
MEYPWISTAVLALMMVIECVCCMKTFIPRATKLQKFRKITVDSTGRNIFVGGKNSLYHLDANLNEIGLHGVSTGPRKDSKICIREEMETNPDMCDIQLSDDYPQVLQVYRNLLVTCGTVSLGECVGRDLQDISVVNITSSTHFVVNTEKLGTTESVIAEIGTESVLFVAKSHVRSKKNFDANSEVRLIIYAGQLNLIENSFLQPYEYQRNRIFSIQTVNTFEDHSFDFDIKAMLYMKNSKSVYSLLRITNLHQKPLETVSKVSKICAKETAFNSYEDIPIKCADFPHVQDGFAIQYGQSEVLVALFSSAEIVSKTTAGAVCVFTEKELLEGFRKSRIKQCSSPEVYLDPSTTNSCIKPDMVVLLEDEGSCPGETCTECMTNANSKCGWCIMESRCKEKTSCKEENFWLPSVEGACLTVHTNAAGASQINQILKVDVFLNPPVPITGNDWYCEYGKSCKGDGDPCKSKLTINDSGMSCEIEHKDAFLEEEIYRAPFSIGRNGSILVGGWEFLFYTCSGFKTCLDCVNNPKVNKCSWNIQMATCTERVNEPAYVNTDDVSRCPQISKMDLKLPYDRQKNVLIKAKNLPSLSPSDYNCSVSGQVFSVLEVNVTTILCGVKIKTDSPFSVTYKESRIDNPGKDIAT